MDPHASLDIILTSDDLDDITDAAHALATWIRRGGFIPSTADADELIQHAGSYTQELLCWSTDDREATARCARALLGLAILVMTGGRS